MISRKNITSEKIAEVEDLFTAFEICDEFNIPYDGLDNLDQFIERIYLHYTAQNKELPMKRICESMLRDGEEDNKKRRQLVDMFQTLVSIAEPSDEDSERHKFVTDFLSNDGTTKNIIDDCNKRILELGKHEAVLLVAGETSSGKSSFLNLLLGMEILPTNTLPCTTIITTIRYGPTPLFRIVYTDADKEDYETEDLEEFKIIAFPKENREKDHGVQEAKVYMPIDFLKGGLVLTDSPGIGENEFLEEYLIDFISKNEILGFIYIIFSDNSGGVKEDRLMQLLKLIIEAKKKRENSIPFDPKAALFVANRFDALPEESRTSVKEHILEKLKGCYPQFEDSSTIFFSTKNAQRDVTAHPDYINDNYKELLQGFSRLYSYVLERRLRAYYKWIEFVLHRISHCLKTATTRLALNQQENEERSRKHRKRLKKLQTDTDTVIKELRAEVVVQSRTLFDEVKENLATPMSRFRICSAWKDGEIPNITSDIHNAAHWMWVKQRVDDAFYDRVISEMEAWANEKQKISIVEEAIVAKIQEKLGILQDEIISSEHALKSSRQSVASADSVRRSSSAFNSRRMTLRPNLVELPIKMPTKLNKRLNPFAGFGRRKDTAKFEKNPVEWTQHRAEKLLTKLIKNKKEHGASKGTLDLLMETILQRPIAIIDVLEMKIPSIIEANMDLMDTLEEMSLSQSRNAFKYEKMFEDIETLKKTLMTYGEGYVFVHDFKLNEVRIITEQQPSGSSISQTFRVSNIFASRAGSFGTSASIIPQGLWSCLHPAMLQRSGEESPISIRIYTASSGLTNTCQEVAKLRCLLHKDVHIAEFLGIHHTDAETPAYIYDGRLIPLARYMMKTSCPYTRMPRIFESIARGLNHIHLKGLVHMEVSCETVTVDESGEVKLTGACVPRKATLPLDTDMAVGNFVYLPYEVLNGEIYVTSADVYGFGLLMYEVLFESKAFGKERSFAFNDFLRSLDPEKMLGLNTEGAKNLTEQTLNLLRICLKKSDYERSTITAVLNELSEIEDKLRVTGSSRAISRRFTDDPTV
ncbi:uncharacterized protein LOC128217184 isoform X2 [Mya arenaria]|uniref:uncharacterized protein LOC128217184 isoform X2 n=1 Tax=Mya arenaria TaxID=6604 RepID=UPI0022E03489|nr:uncharacterized protein LOC128217184 isoform X2 [Mya arenaria]